MNKLSKFSLMIAGSAILFSCSSGNQESTAEVSGENIQKAEFFVRGNCGMCEERIEETAKAIEGVASADYNVDSKMLSLAFDSTKTDELIVHKAIAATGHKTNEVEMDANAHEKLPECCKEGHSH